MKEYHTSIDIDASVEKVWKALTHFQSYPQWNPIVGKLEGQMVPGQKISTYIVPLKKVYHPTLISFVPNKELIWHGVRGAGFLLKGNHYYRLEKLSDYKTKLLHGEYFTGILSHFIPKSLLNKMENAFLLHNNRLKQRVENEE
jgi:hypothetical protein